MKNIIKTITLSFALLTLLNGSIIISQYVVTNSGNYPKGIELWNVSGATIDFSSSNLDIRQGTNGKGQVQNKHLHLEHLLMVEYQL